MTQIIILSKAVYCIT